MIEAILKRDHEGFKEGEVVKVLGFFAHTDGARAVILNAHTFDDIPLRDLEPNNKE